MWNGKIFKKPKKVKKILVDSNVNFNNRGLGYLGPYQIAIMKLFCENNQCLLAVDYFLKDSVIDFQQHSKYTTIKATGVVL